MLKAFGIFALVVAAVLVVILGLAATKPATFHVERSTVIAAPSERVASLVGDFHQWEQWSPWGKLDPNMRVSYSGPAAGPGAVYEWAGNRKVGKGRMEVLSTTPETTSIKLNFFSPFESHNTSVFTYVPTSTATRVTWSMDGPNTFFSKVMSVFASMDSLIGKDFEQGLANLKSVAESGR